MSRCPVFGGAHGHGADRITVGGDLTLLLGLQNGASVDEALRKLAAASLDFAVVKLSVYEQGTSTPIPNVLIDGLTSMAGGALYTDSQGKAVGRSGSAGATVRVSALYADLNASAVSLRTPGGTVVSAAIYAARVAAGTVVEVLSTKDVMFTAKVASVDVHVIGGGERGQSGDNSSQYVWGGDGGRGGGQNYRLNVSVNVNQKYAAVVGAANGGVSSFLGVTSQSAPFGAEEGGGGGSMIKGYVNGSPGQTGRASSVKLFGSGAVKGGGSGGGGGVRTSVGNAMGPSGGGSPRGGSGGSYSFAGAAGGQPGGGGGGGGNWEGVGAQTGGDGGAGGIYFRWKNK